MCGIIGMVGKSTNGLSTGELSLMKDMLICDAIRGRDSTGLFQVNKHGNAKYVKIASHPYNLLSTAEYKSFESEAWRNGQVLIGHNRKATEGAINNNNAHPFVHGNIVLVHNGGISNFRSLVDIRQREKHDITVDSHGVAYLLSKGNTKHVLKELRGAFALVWYNTVEKVLSIIRNDYRPMSFALDNGRLFLASEKSMLQWLLPRYGIDKAQYTELKSGVLVQMKINEGDFESTHEEIVFDKPFTSMTKTYYPVVTSANDVTTVVARQAYLENREAQRQKRNKGFKSVEEIPFEHRFNIHYGADELVLEEGEVGHRPFQQIVFKVDDYKEIEGVADAKIAWGKALDSESLEVKFNFMGTDDDFEKLLDADHLIGVVDRVKWEHMGTLHYQVVMVKHVRPVRMTVSPNGVPYTEEHFLILSNMGNCECGTKICDFKMEDKSQINYLRQGFDTKLKCQWCIDAEAASEPEKVVIAQ